MDTQALTESLQQSEDFDAAAVHCLSHLLAVGIAALRASSYEDASLRRAMLHLRPQQGYRGLFVLESGSRELSAPGVDPALLPSASVWKRLVEVGRPLAVDTSLQLVTPRGADAEAGAWANVLSDRTRARLLGRQTTHLYMLPLHAPSGLVGMVSLEAACASAIGQPFVWEACSDALERAVALCGPYLAGLPRRVAEVKTGDALLPVVGPTMQALVNVLEAFSAEEETLLIRGETGTGKSRIARWCHAHSSRGDGPFEVLDLLGVPEETQQGELFGWKRGAFTGAVSAHDGYVARAEGGTLFLDEIDKLSLKAQAALLLLMEERKYRVLGDAAGSREANVRFIVGTNVDLLGAVRDGRFREDLYYRVNVLPMALPPLRERRDEIGAWAEHMLRRRHADKKRAGKVLLAKDAADALCAAEWPGNLRQLDNVVRRAHTLASIGATGPELSVELRHFEQAQAFELGTAVTSGTDVEGALSALERHAASTGSDIAAPIAAIRAALAGVVPAPKAEVKPARRLEDLSEREVLEALEQTGYRRAKAAEALGISRSSLYSFSAKSKLIPKPTELTRDAIVAARDTCEGDLAKMACQLRVSQHGLKLRLQELSLSLD